MGEEYVRDAERGVETQFRKKARFRYNSPLVQVCMIGLVCFCCPGMFNALSGMGGGGQVDHTAVNNANTALYTTFAVFGILDGGIYNILGPRYTLFAGCSTYVLYADAFLYYNHYKHQAFAIVAGAILGFGAGLLWAGQGAIMTSYPPQHRKGILLSFGVFSTWVELLFQLPWLVTSFTVYQFNNVNGLLFNLRTSGLNNMFYWGAQMLGSVGIGYIFDYSFEEPEKEGTGIWAGGLANQLTYSAEDLPEKLDFKISGSGYAGRFVLYFSYGLLDAMFQSMVYWVIGALADDSETLSRYAGFHKGIQSAGGAAAWQIDAHGVSLLGQLIINWSLTTISYPLLVLLVMLAVKNKNEVQDGETKGSVLTSSSLSNGNEGNEK
ncbi:hypothetical protein MKX01_004869 [Papaver californicum]|nr:hypothetical protein MKX01_004869 [Papaver californicum]